MDIQQNTEAIKILDKGECYIPLVDPYCAAMHLGHMASYKFALRFAYGRKVLDLGCGTGYGSTFLASFGAAEVVGADIAEEAVDYASKYHKHPAARFILLTDDKTLPFEDGSFDFVFCSQVIEHIENPESLLKEFLRVLNPGGFALVTTPNKTIFSPHADEHSSSNEFHISEMNLSQYEKLGRRVFPGIKLAGIPQNCVKPGADNTLIVKENELIVPDDYRVREDNLDDCENLLLFGHTLKEGTFDVSLPGEKLELSESLAPLFRDSSLERWIILDNYPATISDGIHYSKSPVNAATEFLSSYDKLYRVDVGLASDGKHKIEIIITKTDPAPGEVPVLFHEIVNLSGNKLRLEFPPVENSAQMSFRIELKSLRSFIDRLIKKDGVEFEFRDGKLPIWTFNRL
ncbi:MAG: class I SAM-dependent methyltransferase [bacterium]|nr:class I SAM-dependent methyltransferase [bacterium]